MNKLEEKYILKNIIWEYSQVYVQQCSEVFHKLLV